MIESHCFNNGHWWDKAGSINTYYGQWEMQSNKILGIIYRIIDPQNKERCWGTQKMVIPIFTKLKNELEKECPPQKDPRKK